MKALDVITIGRSSVDLYGAQIGGASRTWGRSANISAVRPPISAAARLGLKFGLITRVGDEHITRYDLPDALESLLEPHRRAER